MEKSPPPPGARSLAPSALGTDWFYKSQAKGCIGWSQQVSPLQDTNLTLLNMSRFPAWFPKEAQPAHVSCLAQECLYSKLTGWFQPRNWCCKVTLQIPWNRWLSRRGKPSQRPPWRKGCNMNASPNNWYQDWAEPESHLKEPLHCSYGEWFLTN